MQWQCSDLRKHIQSAKLTLHYCLKNHEHLAQVPRVTNVILKVFSVSEIYAKWNSVASTINALNFCIDSNQWMWLRYVNVIVAKIRQLKCKHLLVYFIHEHVWIKWIQSITFSARTPWHSSIMSASRMMYRRLQLELWHLRPQWKKTRCFMLWVLFNLFMWQHCDM